MHSLPTAPRRAAISGLAACAAVMLLLCGCHKAVSTEGQTAAAAPDETPAKDSGSQSESKDKGEAKDKCMRQDPKKESL